MATYKVIQNVEAEDKLLGPLTLRQFIYAAIAAVCLYLSFLVFTKHIYFMLLIFIPVIATTVFFAFPWKRDQPTEVWALAKIRFMLKPHKRIWNQSGVKELVSVTAPKREKQNYTDNLTAEQIQSRLKALASTIDTRGWATKNVNVKNVFTPAVMAPGGSILSSDRLIGANMLPQTVPDVNIQAADDVLDEKNNPTAYNFDQMIKSSSKQHRDQIVDEVYQAAQGKTPQDPRPDYWFLNQVSASHLQSVPSGFATFDTRVISPGSSYDSITPESELSEEEIARELRQRRDTSQDIYNQHIKVIEPPLSKKTKKKSKKLGTSAKSPQVTQAPDPAILALANNNDLNVATIARQANKTNKPPLNDEVVIKLH